MRRIKQIIPRALAFAFAVMLMLPVFKTAYAANAYEPLEVKLPYRHLYTTTDTSVDSLFHYVITPKDNAPLPAEADVGGVFTYDGTSGTGVKDGNKTVFDLQGNLTFTFTEPGQYVYTVTGDLATDNEKVNADRYYFESRVMTITFYIINEPGSDLKLKMLTAEDTDEDVKVNEVEFDPTYEYETEEPEPEPDPDKPATGDRNDMELYVTLLAVAAAALILLVCLRRFRKGE